MLVWAWTSSKLHLECPHRHATIHPARPLWLHGHVLSFTVKPWASRDSPAMHEWSYQACTWSQRTSCCLSLAACLVTRSSDSYHSSKSKLACVLPIHSTCLVAENSTTVTLDTVLYYCLVSKLVSEAISEPLVLKFCTGTSPLDPPGSYMVMHAVIIYPPNLKNLFRSH